MTDNTDTRDESGLSEQSEPTYEVKGEATAEDASVLDGGTDEDGAFSENGDSYTDLIARDLAELRAEFSELSELSDITELENPTRYGALRDLGLTPAEAYRATSTRKETRTDTRSHLRSAAPRHALAPDSRMSYRELEMARELFGDMSDKELQRLYKRVTK